jgi:hypothetical protein
MGPTLVMQALAGYFCQGLRGVAKAALWAD